MHGAAVSPEPFLTGHNDLSSIYGDLLPNILQELGVGLHVATPQPPAPHTQGCSLLH